MRKLWCYAVVFRDIERAGYELYTRCNSEKMEQEGRT